MLGHFTLIRLYIISLQYNERSDLMSEKLALTITVMVLSTLLGIAKIVVEQKLIENANKIPTEQQDIKEML